MAGNRIELPLTYYDLEFGPDHVLRAWRTVGDSVPLNQDGAFAGTAQTMGFHAVPVSKIGLYASHGDLENVRAQLRDHVDVNLRDNLGMSPLHAAALFGHKDVAELLLANKADVNAKDNIGVTPLLWALSRGHEDVAILLLANNADVNAKGPLGHTALHYAAGKGYLNIVKLLLAHKADVNAREQQGYTPLDYAIFRGHKDVAELLRQHGGHGVQHHQLKSN